MNIYPGYSDFLKKARKGKTIPVYIEILADMETPVSVYKKISKENPYSFLLESVEGGAHVGRFSFIGCDSKMVFRSKGRDAEILTKKKKEKIVVNTRPLKIMKDVFRTFQYVPDPHLPSFCGGAVGYVAYDYIRFLEDIPDQNKDLIDVFDLYFVLYDVVIVFDHAKRKMQVVSHAELKLSGPRKAYDQAVKRIHQVMRRIRMSPNALSEIKSSKSTGKLKSNFSKKAYEKAVLKCKKYIKNGDILQVVLSQVLSKKITCHPFDIYRTLRTINPSPYMFYLDYPGLTLIGSSPEIMVTLNGDVAQVRPIAGTRGRGKTDKDDQKLVKELLADEKERAEHIMLVDLGRNDLGRVCQSGSVKVTDLMGIEKYSHVMHIVSNVEGLLRREYDAFDLFEATFPAGTVSGAPKIRAMEIIDEVEPTRRGAYSGAVGYFSFSGDLDSCITIRTIVVKDKTAYVQAGAGIVADSKPKKEYEETLNKAGAMIRAVYLAEKGEI